MATLEVSSLSPIAVMIAKLSKHCGDLKRKNLSLINRIEEIKETSMQELSKPVLSKELEIYRTRIVKYADILFKSQEESHNNKYSEKVSAKLGDKHQELRDQILFLASSISQFKKLHDALPDESTLETETIVQSSSSQSNTLKRIPTELSFAETASWSKSDTTPPINEEDQ